MGIYKASAKSSSGTLPAAAHPHTVDGFKGLRATGLLSPAKQRQRGDRIDFHIKGMQVMEKEKLFQLKGCICTRRSKQAVNVFKLEIRSFLTAFQHGIGLCDSYLASRQSQICLQRVTLIMARASSRIQKSQVLCPFEFVEYPWLKMFCASHAAFSSWVEEERFGSFLPF